MIAPSVCEVLSGVGYCMGGHLESRMTGGLGGGLFLLTTSLREVSGIRQPRAKLALSC